MESTTSFLNRINGGVGATNRALRHTHNALTLKEMEDIVFNDSLFISTSHAETILNQTSAFIEAINRDIRGLLRRQCQYPADEDIRFRPDSESGDFIVLCQKGRIPIAWHLPLPNSFCAAIASTIASTYDDLFKEPYNLKYDEFNHDEHGKLVSAPWVIKRKALEKMIFSCSKQMQEERYHQQRASGPMHERHTVRNGIQDRPSSESAPGTSRGRAKATGEASTRAPDGSQHGRDLRPRVLQGSLTVMDPNDYAPERNLRSRGLRTPFASAPTPASARRKATLADQQTKVAWNRCAHGWEVAPKAMLCDDCKKADVAIMQCNHCKTKLCDGCRAKLP